jgi:hypothetical protein
MGKRLQSINAHSGEIRPRVWKLGDWIREVFLPSVAASGSSPRPPTTGDRISGTFSGYALLEFAIWKF